MTEHIAWTETINEYTTHDVMCGTWLRGSMALCDKHEQEALETYPQGWSYYPGDVCMHGQYVGGSGIDYMCHECEMGYTERHIVHRYRMMWTLEGEPPFELKRFIRFVDDPSDETEEAVNEWWERISKWFLGEGRLLYELADKNVLSRITTYVVHDSFIDWVEPTR